MQRVWQSLKIEATHDKAEALSDTLMELGALSVSIGDACAGTLAEQPLFGEPGCQEPGLWPNCLVSALFAHDADLAAVVKALNSFQPLRHSIETFQDQDWVRYTHAQFEPIQISPRLWIVPTWHTPPDPDAINLILDPGQAFGSGTHPTTRFCLEWLDHRMRGGEAVLDYGCGSGILAIAAMRLGAGRAVGVDIDPEAVSTARQNAKQNGVQVAFAEPDTLAAATGTFTADVVMANILANPLKILAPLLAGLCRPGGQIVLSGILSEQGEEVATVYRTWFDMELGGNEEGWIWLAGARK